MDDRRRWFALVLYEGPESDAWMGYPLDYYPEEWPSYFAENHRHIIGDYASVQEAQAAVRKRLELIAWMREKQIDAIPQDQIR